MLTGGLRDIESDLCFAELMSCATKVLAFFADRLASESVSPVVSCINKFCEAGEGYKYECQSTHRTVCRQAWRAKEHGNPSAITHASEVDLSRRSRR